MPISNKRHLIKTWQYVAMPVIVSKDSGVLSNGRLIVKSGIIAGGKERSVFANIREPVSHKNSSAAEGVILNDVDVTSGDAPGYLIIHGIVHKQNLPEQVSDEAVKQLKLIRFI